MHFFTPALAALIICFSVTGCQTPPPMTQVPEHVAEEPINTPQGAATLKAKHSK